MEQFLLLKVLSILWTASPPSEPAPSKESGEGEKHGINTQVASGQLVSASSSLGQGIKGLGRKPQATQTVLSADP